MTSDKTQMAHDPDSNEARLERHRKLHNIGLPPFPAASESDDEPTVKFRAYLHPTSDGFVTTDPNAYANPRKLVAWDDVIDRIEWLDKGIAEWRASAIDAGRQLKIEREKNKLLVDAATKAAPQPIYMFRRNGLDDFCTCTKSRYDELSRKPHLFETKIAYTDPVPAPQREWVELEDDEVTEIADRCIDVFGLADLISEALRTKNEGKNT